MPILKLHCGLDLQCKCNIKRNDSKREKSAILGSDQTNQKVDELTMSRYHHLTISERENILVMNTKGWSLRKIAAALSRSPSTISRELSRNSPDYSPHAAQERYKLCRPRRAYLLGNEELKDTVERLLRILWSPEQIESRLRLECSQSVSYAMARNLLGTSSFKTL